jgi:hypothetical protein
MNEFGKNDDRFTDGPPAWALDLFTDKQRQRLTYTKLWQKSVAASHLDQGTKLVALALSLYFSGGEDDVADPSGDGLADDTSMHRSTVIRKLDRLAEVGLIERKRSKGRVRTRYRLTVPDDLPLNPQPSHRATVAQDDGWEGSEGPTVALSDPTVAAPPSTVALDQATVAQGDTKGLEGVKRREEEGGAANADRLRLPSIEDQQQPKPANRRAQGASFAQLLADNKITDETVSAMADRLSPTDRREFLEGLRQAVNP